MATHITCEAVRKGLETQVIALTAGYEAEIGRLHSQITAFSGGKSSDDQALQTKNEAMTKQYAEEIAQLQSQQANAMIEFETKTVLDLEAKAEQAQRVLSDQLREEYMGKYKAVKTEEQAKREEQRQDHLHVTAKLEAEVLSLQNAVEAAKYETQATKESMSQTINNIRFANRSKVGELEERHALINAEFKHRLTSGTLDTIRIHMRTLTHICIFLGEKRNPTFAVKRSDPLKVVATKLKAHDDRLLRDIKEFDFGIQCTCAKNFCTIMVTDHSKTLEQLGVNEGSEIRYNEKGHSVGARSKHCPLAQRPTTA